MMITEVDDFFTKGCGRCDRFDTPDCSARIWLDGLAQLRRICLAAGLTETVKWAHPCYMQGDQNVALFGAFRGDVRLSFFHGGLMDDPDGLLEKAGPNAQHPSVLRFTSTAAVAAAEPAIRGFLDQAIKFAQAGLRPPRGESELELPEELVEAMDADPELAEAFHSLTRGRQKSWVIHLAGAKATATRVGRIAKARGAILAGRGALERP